MLRSREFVRVESGSTGHSIVERSISVIMPAYNEAEFIEKNVRDTVLTLSQLGYRFEVIVVDDGSPDNTHEHAFRARLQHPGHVRVVRYDENLGKGNALICGSAYATGDYVVFLDADMDLHPEQLPVFFEILEAKDADVVVGSKHHPLSRVSYPPMRRLTSLAYYALVRLLFGLPVRDTQTGLKVFRGQVLREILPLLLVKRFAFDIELLANAHHRGFKIVDAPVTLNFRRTLGRIRVKDVIAVLQDTLAIFYRLRILRYYDKVRERREADLRGTAREIHVPDA
jgi:glycosyltransferase involved in cell wall biosynthesis